MTAKPASVASEWHSVPMPQPWLPAELHEFDGTVWRLVYNSHGRLALLVRREVVWEGPAA